MMHGLCPLGAFFDRDMPQKNFATLIRRLAYQLATFDACFGAVMSQVVTINENIADASAFSRRVWERSRSQGLNASPVKGFVGASFVHLNYGG